MANAFKSGASQSRSTNDFNERAKRLSERLGEIEKPVQSKRSNAPRRSFKSGPRPEGDAAQPTEGAETRTDEAADGHSESETETEA